MTWQVLEADCVEAMAAMPEASVDAVVCDPPYGLEFMGKTWDRLDGARIRQPSERDQRPGMAHNATTSLVTRNLPDAYVAGPRMQAWHEVWAREALRVLKPGGHLLAFGGTRTYHRLACAVEDAGFEVRDCLAWLYGSGFPKSLDVSKAIDKAAGAEREVVGTKLGQPGYSLAGHQERTVYAHNDNLRHPERECAVTAPATPDAERWEGWGTALKPAHEPIVLARKPLAGTVAANVLAHGTGALNVDGCRIEGDVPSVPQPALNSPTGNVYGYQTGEGRNGEMSSAPGGRWPANVVMDEQAAALLEAQTGELGPGAFPSRRGADGDRLAHGAFNGQDGLEARRTDSGGASRFLYVAKASSAERNAGLDGFEADDARNYGGGPLNRPDHESSDGARRTGARMPRQNVHPTVKPIELMRWLVRLVTPPGGVVLDPFTGSGTTGIACVLEGLRFVGIEREPEYAAIARARIAWWMAHPEGVEIVKALEAERTRQKIKGAGQVSLFDMAAEPEPDASGNGRAGEATADQRYTDSGASNFAMRPGRRRP